MTHMEYITGWLSFSVWWYWIVVLCSLMTTAICYPAIPGILLLLHRNWKTVKCWLQVVGSDFQYVKTLDIHQNWALILVTPWYLKCLGVIQLSSNFLSAFIIVIIQKIVLTVRRHFLWQEKANHCDPLSQHVFPAILHHCWVWGYEK